MYKILSAVAGEMKKDASTNEITELIRKHITRRQFLVGTSAVGVGVASLCIFGCGSNGNDPSTTTRQIFVANALGMIVADPSRCGTCRRCEMACVAYNPNQAPAGQTQTQYSVSNVKVSRNKNFGIAGVPSNGSYSDGDYGNFRTPQDTCRQCPHPVPCQLACPQAAIQVIEPVNARVVNLDLCIGCGICVAACPWAMTALSGAVLAAATKSHKCTLCGGTVLDTNGNITTNCVQICPNGALSYQPWVDMTKVIPPRQTVPASIQLPADVAATCSQCH
jgi:Fe-S-cluster-containing dehydrogenase component